MCRCSTTRERHERTIDVGCPGPELFAHRKLEEIEGQGEALRLLYVALTRAQHQTVIWWAGSRDTKNSPSVAADVRPWAGRRGAAAREEAAARLHGRGTPSPRWAPRCPSSTCPAPDARWQPDSGAAVDLEAAVFDRSLDVDWRRVSYSSITRALHGEPLIGSEPEEPLTSDEETPVAPWSTVGTGPDEDGCRSTPLGLAGMPGGALVGTIVHGVLWSGSTSPRPTS